MKLVTTLQQGIDMKCLFLDIDGVLQGWPKQEPFPKAVDALNQWLQDHPDWVVVISSSWRLEHNLQGLIHLLGGIGVKHLDRIQGVTPVLYKLDGMPEARIKEIRAFLDQHAVTDFMVVDDQPIWIDHDGERHHDREILERLVEVNPRRGLRPDDFDI